MIIIVNITNIINTVIEAKASLGRIDAEKLLVDRRRVKGDADRNYDDAGATSDAGDSSDTDYMW